MTSNCNPILAISRNIFKSQRTGLYKYVYHLQGTSQNQPHSLNQMMPQMQLNHEGSVSLFEMSVELDNNNRLRASV